MAIDASILGKVQARPILSPLLHASKKCPKNHLLPLLLSKYFQSKSHAAGGRLVKGRTHCTIFSPPLLAPAPLAPGHPNAAASCTVCKHGPPIWAPLDKRDPWKLSPFPPFSSHSTRGVSSGKTHQQPRLKSPEEEEEEEVKVWEEERKRRCCVADFKPKTSPPSSLFPFQSQSRGRDLSRWRISSD